MGGKATEESRLPGGKRGIGPMHAGWKPALRPSGPPDALDFPLKLDAMLGLHGGADVFT